MARKELNVTTHGVVDWRFGALRARVTLHSGGRVDLRRIIALLSNSQGKPSCSRLLTTCLCYIIAAIYALLCIVNHLYFIFYYLFCCYLLGQRVLYLSDAL